MFHILDYERFTELCFVGCAKLESAYLMVCLYKSESRIPGTFETIFWYELFCIS